MINIRVLQTVVLISFVLSIKTAAEGDDDSDSDDVFYHSGNGAPQEPTTTPSTGNSTRRRRRPATRRTTLSTRASYTFTHKFFPEPEFCDELLPIFYRLVIPGDPPNLIELEWTTPDLLTISIVGGPFTRSTGFIMQARLRNTITPVGTFPGDQDATIYDCPPGRINTIRKQISEHRYFYSVNWERPQNISTENISLVVNVLKPFDRYYQKILDLPPFPDRFVSAEISENNKTMSRRPVKERTKRYKSEQQLWKAMYAAAGVRYDGGTNIFP